MKGGKNEGREEEKERKGINRGMEREKNRKRMDGWMQGQEKTDNKIK